MTILAFGVAWRPAGILLLPQNKDHSGPRSRATLRGAGWVIVRRMWPNPERGAAAAVSTGLGYLLYAGLFIVVFFTAAHVAFIEDLAGISWPHLPNPLVTVTGALTLAAAAHVGGRYEDLLARKGAPM